MTAKMIESLHKLMDSPDAAAGDTPQKSSPGLTGTISDAGLIVPQLERILACRFFASSKRYSGLLRYLVERTLEGQADSLKERTIGVEVFGRPLEYDSNTDHVVRTAAGEIRKRLAQYYHEPGHEGELRIDVPPGAYVPRFRPAPETAATAPVPAEDSPRTESPAGSLLATWRIALAVATFVALAAIAGVAIAMWPKSRNIVDRFWSPLTSSERPILLCVGDASRVRRAEADLDHAAAGPPDTWTLEDFARYHSPSVNGHDAIALARLTGTIQPRHRDVRILRQSEATFDDLRGGPAVLIGEFSNEWTQRLTGKERFTVSRDSSMLSTIRDKAHPGQAGWSVDYSTPFLQFGRDYAVVSRIRNPTTEQIVVLVGGLYAFANVGGAEFLSNPEYLKGIEAYAPADWDSKNLELVLSIDVIKGKTGVPRILAAHFW